MFIKNNHIHTDKYYAKIYYCGSIEKNGTRSELLSEPYGEVCQWSWKEPWMCSQNNFFMYGSVLVPHKYVFISTLWTVDFILQTVDFTILSVDYTLQTVSYTLKLSVIHSNCRLYTQTVDYTHPTVDYTLQSVDYTLQSVDYTLQTGD